MVQHGPSTLGRLLAATRLYDLAGDNPLDWELDAYLAGFDMVEQRCVRAMEDAFIQTCGEERLRRWERFLDLPCHPAAPREDRRRLVLRRVAVGPGDSTVAGMHRSLLAAGVEAQLTEHFGTGTLSVDISGYGSHGSLSAAIAEAQKMLPAHLTALFVLTGPSWLTTQLWNKTWLTIQLENLNWQELEALPDEV